MNKQAFDELCEYATEKVAISSRTVLRAATRAHGSGASPARLQKFWNTFDNWGIGANARASDSLVFGSPGLQAGSNFASSQQKQQLFDNALNRVNKSLPAGVKPLGVRLDTADTQNPAYAAKFGKPDSGVISSSRDPRVLLHEVGHYKDHNLRPAFFERPGGWNVLNLEAMANRHASRLAKATGVPNYAETARLNEDSYGLAALLHLRNRTTLDKAIKPAGRVRRAIDTMPDMRHVPHGEKAERTLARLSNRQKKVQDTILQAYDTAPGSATSNAASSLLGRVKSIFVRPKLTQEAVALRNAAKTKQEKLWAISDAISERQRRLYQASDNWGYYRKTQQVNK